MGDPFWGAFFPPNGWGCRCYVTNLTKHQLEKEGLTVEKTEGKIKPTTVLSGDKEMPSQTFTFENTGRMVNLTPDAGWGTNLGIKAWGIDVQAWNKVEGLPEEVKYNFIAKMAEASSKENKIRRLIDNALTHLDRPEGKREAAAWLTPIVYKKLTDRGIAAKTPLIGIQEGDISHLFGTRKNPAQRLTQKQLYDIHKILKEPDEIYLDTTDNSLNFIKNLKEDEIEDNRDCIKINIKIDKSSNKKIAINRIGSAARVNKKDSFNNSEIHIKIE